MHSENSPKCENEFREPFSPEVPVHPSMFDACVAAEISQADFLAQFRVFWQNRVQSLLEGCQKHEPQGFEHDSSWQRLQQVNVLSENEKNKIKESEFKHHSVRSDIEPHRSVEHSSVSFPIRTTRLINKRPKMSCKNTAYPLEPSDFNIRTAVGPCGKQIVPAMPCLRHLVNEANRGELDTDGLMEKVDFSYLFSLLVDVEAFLESSSKLFRENYLQTTVAKRLMPTSKTSQSSRSSSKSLHRKSSTPSNHDPEESKERLFNSSAARDPLLTLIHSRRRVLFHSQFVNDSMEKRTPG